MVANTWNGKNDNAQTAQNFNPTSLKQPITHLHLDSKLLP